MKMKGFFVYFPYLKQWGEIMDYQAGLIEVKMQTLVEREDEPKTKYINPNNLEPYGNGLVRYIEP